jgi:dihydroorotate dehydrogenase
VYGTARALAFRLDAERAHHLALRALRGLGLPGVREAARAAAGVSDARLAVTAFGLRFPSPLGLAAGFDKGEGVAAGLFALGFGAVEVGTLTPRAQDGNPRPRLFRLPRHRALINRMGFNNPGAAAAARRLARLRFRPGPLGVNLGMNRDTPAEGAADDLLAVLAATREVGDYFVVNVSSPNTPGLRALQRRESLSRILEPLVAAAAGKAVLVKLAPDLADAEVVELAGVARAGGAAGLVLANTTVDHAAVADDPLAGEAGGLSGPPLRGRARELVRLVFRAHRDRLPLVGVGGVESAADAYALLRAGARVVQAYTGFVYGGPGFPRRVLRGLLRLLERDGLAGVEAAVGLDA